MALDILHDNWGPYTHTEVENALKALLAQMLQDIEDAGIPAGGVTADMLAQSLQTLIKGKYSKPGTGIPASDLEGNIPSSKLAQAVQTSLAKADNSLQGVKDSSGHLLVPTNGVVTLPESEGGGSDVTVDETMSSTSANAVQNRVIKAYVDTAIAALVNGAPGALDTLKELADALGDDADAIAALTNAIAAKANAADLASVATSGSYNDLADKPTILSQQQVQNLIDDAVDDISGGVSKVKIGSTEYSPNSNGVVDISSGVSAAQPTIDPNTGNWIVNGQVTQYPSQGAQGNSGYTGAANELEVVNNLTDGGATKALSAEQGKVLAQRVTEIEESGVGGGMLVERTEDEYHVKYNFVDNSPALAVSTQSIVMGGNTKTATFKVSGQRLKGNINISVSGSNFSLNKTSLSPTDGVVAETTITLTYSGTATATATITISSTGATSKTISAQYTEQQVPTIDISTDTITFKAGVGGTQTKTLLVKGYNLEGAIALAFTNNVGGRFTLSQSSFSPSGGSVNAQVSITYTPQSGDTGTFSATLRATSTSASNVDVPLSGIVSTMDVSKNSIELTTEANTPVTDTFTIEGANLNGDVTIVVSGTGFSVSPLSITKNDAEASGGASVVVTYSPTSVGTNSGQITIQSSGITKYVTLSGTAEEATAFDDETGRFNKNGIYYGAISDGNGGWTNNCKVYNPAYSASGSTYSGTINIPAQVVAGGRTFNVTHIATGAFNGCKTLNHLSLPEGLTTIETNAILNMTNKSNNTSPAVWSVWELRIPYSVVSIGDNFLYHMDNLGYTGTGYNGDTLAGYLDMACATNPNFATTEITTDWYNYCYNLREIVIPDNVTKVKGSAFSSGCDVLNKVTFGANTTECQYGLGNTHIRTIIIRNTSTTPLSTWVAIADEVLQNAHVYVPNQEVLTAYKESAKWGGFYNEDASLNRLHLISDLSNS